MSQAIPAAGTVETEVVIVGAGPCGLFQVFELGLLGINAHIVDSLAHPGGQCAELYPDKPIYDIPALPVCGAQELVDRLMQQIKPFNPQFHLGQEVTELARREDGRFRVRTATGTTFNAGAVVIAGGVGSFQARGRVISFQLESLNSGRSAPAGSPTKSFQSELKLYFRRGPLLLAITVDAHNNTRRIPLSF